MGRCLIKKHHFNKTKFGNISLTKFSQDNPTYTATQGCLAILSCDAAGGSSITTTGEILYQSNTIPNACILIRMKAGDTLKYTSSNYPTGSIINLKNLSAELIQHNYVYGNQSGGARNSTAYIPNPPDVGALYLGVGNYNWHSIVSGSNPRTVLNQSDCFTSMAENTSGRWAGNKQWTIVPNATTSTAYVQSYVNPDGYYGSTNTGAWMFKLTQKI